MTWDSCQTVFTSVAVLSFEHFCNLPGSRPLLVMSSPSPSCHPFQIYESFSVFWNFSPLGPVETETRQTVREKVASFNKWSDPHISDFCSHLEAFRATTILHEVPLLEIYVKMSHSFTGTQVGKGSVDRETEEHNTRVTARTKSHEHCIGPNASINWLIFFFVQKTDAKVPYTWGYPKWQRSRTLEYI